MKHMALAGLAAISLSACIAISTTETPAPQHAPPAMVSPVERQDALSMPEVTIYHLEGRRSERIVWLMEELGLPYTLEYVRGDLNASMAKVRALGHEMPQVPTVTIGDEILVESGAIIETIINRYAPGELTPPIESADYARHLMWLHYAEGSLAARLIADYRTWNIQPPKSRSRLVDSHQVVQFAENHLATHPYFGGDAFSAADIMMLFPLNFGLQLEIVEPERFPNIQAWQARMEARPAYKRMLAAARPDGLIGNLPKVKGRPPVE